MPSARVGAVGEPFARECEPLMLRSAPRSIPLGGPRIVKSACRAHRTCRARPRRRSLRSALAALVERAVRLHVRDRAPLARRRRRERRALRAHHRGDRLGIHRERPPPEPFANLCTDGCAPACVPCVTHARRTRRIDASSPACPPARDAHRVRGGVTALPARRIALVPHRDRQEDAHHPFRFCHAPARIPIHCNTRGPSLEW